MTAIPQNLRLFTFNIANNQTKSQAIDLLGLTPVALELSESGTFFINQRDASTATPMSLYDLIVTDGERDVTQESIRRKFIDASLNPVPLGSQGQLPFGSQARLFYSGAFSTWRNNKGYLSNSDLLVSNNTYFTQESSVP